MPRDKAETMDSVLELFAAILAGARKAADIAIDADSKAAARAYEALQVARKTLEGVDSE